MILGSSEQLRKDDTVGLTSLGLGNLRLFFSNLLWFFAPHLYLWATWFQF